MEPERRYGHLPNDGPSVIELYPGLTYDELESRCHWWTDTSPIVWNEIDGSLARRDESPQSIAKAEDQWARNVAQNIPGLAVSPFPYMFMVHRTAPFSSNFTFLPDGTFEHSADGDWAPIGAVALELVGDKSRWADVHIHLNNVFDHSDFRYGWSYADVAARVAPDAEPHHWDLPNPRLYWPNGTMAYMQRNDRFPIGPWLKRLFRGALVDLWGDARWSNQREVAIKAFLGHHLVKGEAPERFIPFVKGLQLSSPKEFDAALTDLLGQWVELVSKNEKKNPTPRKLTRQEVVLLYYYLWKGGDSEAEITHENVDEVASRYGLSKTKIWPLVLKARSEQSGRSFRTSTPSSRRAALYIAGLLPMLQHIPEAVKMATIEMKDAEAER